MLERDIYNQMTYLCSNRKSYKDVKMSNTMDKNIRRLIKYIILFLLKILKDLLMQVKVNSQKLYDLEQCIISVLTSFAPCLSCISLLTNCQRQSQAINLSIFFFKGITVLDIMPVIMIKEIKLIGFHVFKFLFIRRGIAKIFFPYWQPIS